MGCGITVIKSNNIYYYYYVIRMVLPYIKWNSMRNIIFFIHYRHNQFCSHSYSKAVWTWEREYKQVKICIH